MRRATVAIEDERFYKHGGVDLNAIVRAGIKNLESGKTVQGGSTITQQLVRALYIKDPKRDFARKIREAKLASELEKSTRRLGAPQLPERGAVRDRRRPHGDRRRGRGGHVLQQAREEAQADQAALLAGLPQAPSEYNPFRNPQAALARRNEVLRKMAETGTSQRPRPPGRRSAGSGSATARATSSAASRTSSTTCRRS